MECLTLSLLATPNLLLFSKCVHATAQGKKLQEEKNVRWTFSAAPPAPRKAFVFLWQQQFWAITWNKTYKSSLN